MDTFEILAFTVVLFVCIAFVLDLLGTATANLKKKPYKSIIGSFIEDLSDRQGLWWFPILIAVAFIYGLKVCGFFDL